jgi:two-component system sensor histidine kinase YesM
MAILVRKEFIETVYRGLTANTQNIAVISPEGDLISGMNPDDSYITDNNHAARFDDGKGSFIDNKAGVQVSYVSLDNPDWKLVAYTPLKELYKDAFRLRRAIILFSVLTVIILSVLNLFIAFDFINPIRKLVDGMKKVQDGKGNVYIDDDRKDELGLLGETFNEMSREINHLVTWVYREQLTRKEAEIKALQSQINPHFLFNTLELINWMAQLNNVPEISDTVSDLSALMEAGIGRDDRLITLEEEIEYINRYISILKKRFEDKLEFVLEIRTDASRIRIPRLLLQPLVENAVFHGIEKLRGKGTVSLKAETHNNMLVVEVTDNGPGIDENELEKLNASLSVDNDTYFRNLAAGGSKKVGIENVNRRIKLFYGENYGLKITA